MDFTLILIVGLVVAVLAALVWAHRAGAAKSEAEAARNMASAQAAAAVERLKMQAEAARIEREVSDLTEAELEAELSAWSRSRR
ncbi:hypothetical protein [Mesorhizobium sp. KR1-2]|uniref:hypothetical protein n=1 Tax=Mesorhizobium sp. KR1-2 TaxID=3156609 RepID=UPI0032B34989